MKNASRTYLLQALKIEIIKCTDGLIYVIFFIGQISSKKVGNLNTTRRKAFHKSYVKGPEPLVFSITAFSVP